MTEVNLKYKIEQLSDSDRKLLEIKIKVLNNPNGNRSNSKKQKKIVAYLEVDNSLDTDNLKTYLKNKLPDYMIPSTILEVEKIPLLPNGKVDKQELLKTKFNDLKKETNQISVVKPTTEIEEKLVKIWEEVLDFAPISIQDNFFEIGGDSILSIQIISKARKAGIDLKANQIFENQTILGLSKRLAEAEKKKETWDFMAKIRNEGSKNPLFCIHSGGGHVFFYGLLKKYLKENRPIYAVQPLGLNGFEEMHQSVEEMTSEYLKAIRVIQPNGPYNILVYCFSTSVGNEMAIQLDKVEEKINIIVADTMASPWNATDSDSLKTRILSFLTRLLINPYKAIKTFLKDRAYLLKAIKGKYLGKSEEKQLEVLKSNLRKISVDYTWKKNNGKVSLILTDKPDKNFNKFIIKSWKKYAKGGVTVFPTKGNHTMLFEEPDIKFVAEQIDKCIID